VKKQPALFTAADLPLFSGTCQRARVETFTPRANPQPALFTACPLCFGSGKIITRKGKPAKVCPCQLVSPA